jgi:MFS family permease
VTSHSVLQATVGIFCLGATISVLFSMTMGMNQRDAPAAHRGRVLSLTSAAGGTTYGIGLLLFGWLVDQTSMAGVFIVGAALQAAAAIAFGASTKLRCVVDGKLADATSANATSALRNAPTAVVSS